MNTDEHRYINILGLAVLVFLAGLSPAFGQQGQTITTEGVGEVVGEDRAVARDQAIEDALRKAVEQAVGRLVSSEAMAQHFQILQDRIYSQSQGYIQNYRILSEKPETPLHQVTIQAAVAMGDLEKHLQDLGVIPRQVDKPRITVLVAEQNIGREAYYFRWGETAEEAALSIAEKTILDTLREKGFEILDPSAQPQSLKIPSALRFAELDDRAAAAIAKQVDAEVVIVGKVSAKSGGVIGGTSMKSAQANITLRAIQVDDARVLSSGSGNAAAVHIEEATAGSEAIRKASAKLAEKLTEDIIKNFQKRVDASNTIELTIFGLTGAEDLRKFKNSVLGQIPGVEAVQERGFSESLVKMDLEIKGSAHSFSREVSRKTFSEFTVKVLGSTFNTLELQVFPR